MSKATPPRWSGLSMGLRVVGLATIAPVLALGIAATEAHAGPVLFEVCYDGPGADANDVFTEIYGPPGLGLTGWSLQGINGATGSAYRTISLTGLTIPQDGLLVLATSSASGSVLSARDAIANVDWQNGPDAVRLLDGNGSTVDALQYGTLKGFAAGEGRPAPDVSAGYSLSRDLFATDTNDNATDFTSLSTPTPGTGPTLTPVPEPGSFALLLAGGASYVAFRRRVRRDRARSPRGASSPPPPRRGKPSR